MADFSGVRVHTGGEAVQMNQELGAQAFTHGSDVYFGAGKSPGNNELTAHELTHVVQQNEEVLRNKNEQTENSQIHSQEIQTIVSCQRSEGYLQAQEEQSHSQSESNPESLLTSQERSGVQELLSGMNGINRNAALFIAGAFYQWLRNNGELGRWVLEAVSLGTSSVSEDLEAVEESLPRSGPFEMGRTAGDLAGIVTGVLEMIAGGGAVAGGGSLCLTGIGCIAGAPATVVGGATAVHGGSVVIEGTGNIAEDFAGLVSQVFAISGGGEGNGGDTNDINWEWKSKPTFGHTFNRHYAYTTARNSRRHGEITFTIAIN
ncbi:eCIS core domain-containing protein [Coleofasciculus sp. E1-EBD-02]|uniref:eCIS core domain-containing protein n=1 Tax=Coleofasciculus sp. E1-EBD-02 TaxID=3068481 RepID=UPI0032F30D07